MTIIPPIRGPDANELSQPIPWPCPSNSSLALRGWSPFLPLNLRMDLLDGFFLSVPFPLFLTKLATITRVRSVVPLFLPHDHTRHSNAYVCTPRVLPVFLGLWFPSALVVTYYCLISFPSLFFLWFCVFPRSWVIIRVFGCARVRSSKLFSLSPFLFSDCRCSR